MKMSTILKSLNAPFKRDKAVNRSMAVPLESGLDGSAAGTLAPDGVSKSSASMRTRALGNAGAINVHGDSKMRKNESNRDLN